MHLSATGIVGRSRALEVADALLRPGSPPAILEVRGEPGIGKTEVWSEVLRRAEASEHQILWCRPSEREHDLALAAVADLIGAVEPSVLGSLPPPQRHAIDLLLLRTAPTGPAPTVRTLGTAVRTVLSALAGGAPVLVAVDDAQWLDASSAAVLSFVLRRGVPGAAWLVVGRDETEPVLDLARLGVEGSRQRIDLEPLTIDEIREVLARRPEIVLTRPLLIETHRIAGGNPLHAVEVAQMLTRARGVAPPSTSPQLRELLAARLGQLPAATRRALLVTAAMFEPSLGELDESDLAPAEAAGLVHISDDGRIRFTHPLYAAAVYDGAPRRDRRRVHARLAAQVQDPERRGMHLALASNAPDEAVAVALEVAAEHARARGAWHVAASLLLRAADLTPATDVASGWRRRLDAASHLVHAGDRRQARELLEILVDAGVSPDLVPRGLLLLADIHLNDQDFLTARHLLARAAAESDDPQVELAAELNLAFVAANLGDFGAGNRHASRARDLSGTVGLPPAEAEATAYSVMFEFLIGHGVDWDALQHALDHEDPARVVPLQSRPSTVAAMLCLYAGAHEEARHRLVRLREAMTETGDESDVAFLLIWWSWLETRTGALDDALDHALDAEALAGLTGSAWLRSWAAMQAAYVRSIRGDPTVREACEAGLRDAERAQNGLLWLWVAAASAAVELVAGRPAEALRACEPLVSRIEAEGIGEPSPSFFLPDAIEAMVRVGAVDRADALVVQLEAAGRALGRDWATAHAAAGRALVLGARGELDEALAAAQRAVALHELAGHPFDTARALLVRGATERRMRRRNDARTSFERSAALFVELRADAWAAIAEAEMSRLGLRRTEPGSLTESEQRVAELTAAGRTRREVAAALHVSPKTVDATLARVYRKLDIRSRAELGARMATRRSEVDE